MRRVGIIGSTSNRYRNFYRNILLRSDFEIDLWSRSNIEYDISSREKIVDIEALVEDKSLDLILCFLPSQVNYDFLSVLNFNCPVLIETPVTDTRWLKFNKFKIGVLEQWPYYPLEMFKREVYGSGLISKPYQLFNDCRSFDYHAIAQLRKINNFPKPVRCMGLLQNREQPGFIDISGNINNSNEDWTYGMALLEDSTVLLYNFAYNCKKSILKPFQLIRHCSVDGSITTGRSGDIQNDYEMSAVTYLDGKTPKRESIEREVSESGELLSLSIEKVKWENKFKSFSKDSEIAALYLLEDAISGDVYPPLESYVDILTTNAMKQSAINNTVINFQ